MFLLENLYERLCEDKIAYLCWYLWYCFWALHCIHCFCIRLCWMLLGSQLMPLGRLFVKNISRQNAKSRRNLRQKRLLHCLTKPPNLQREGKVQRGRKVLQMGKRRGSNSFSIMKTWFKESVISCIVNRQCHTYLICCLWLWMLIVLWNSVVLWRLYFIWSI